MLLLDESGVYTPMQLRSGFEGATDIRPRITSIRTESAASRVFLPVPDRLSRVGSWYCIAGACSTEGGAVLRELVSIDRSCGEHPIMPAGLWPIVPAGLWPSMPS